jgi:hypothetical protein
MRAEREEDAKTAHTIAREITQIQPGGRHLRHGALRLFVCCEAEKTRNR